MKKISDEAAAGIFAFTWEGFLYLAMLIEYATGSRWGYILWLVDTAVQITMLIYDAKVSKLEQQLKKSRQRLAKQSMDFTEYVRTHETAEPNPKTKIIDIKALLDKRKSKGA